MFLAVTAIGAVVFMLWDGDDRPPLKPYLLRLAIVSVICGVLAAFIRFVGPVGLFVALAFMLGGVIGRQSAIRSAARRAARADAERIE